MLPTGDLSLADCFDHRRCNGFRCRLAPPDHVLKGRIKSLALFHRGLDQIFHLGRRRAVAATQRESVAIDKQSFIMPDGKMTHPYLFINKSEQLVHRLPSRGRYPEMKI